MPRWPVPEAPTPPNSIAVLPFVDMSPDKDQEHFSDGLSEELLNLLAQLPQLHVIARTSSFSFKGKDADVATIARCLRVAHVLEGSVRKSGNRLRVTAQLIRSGDSAHLWSQSYERELTDVFEMQDEIAGAVVSALKVKLLPEQHFVNAHRTASPEAYELYLVGQDVYPPGRYDNFQRAVQSYQRAIALDPAYAAAWRGSRPRRAPPRTSRRTRSSARPASRPRSRRPSAR
jgi:TolB-like protein